MGEGCITPSVLACAKAGTRIWVLYCFPGFGDSDESKESESESESESLIPKIPIDSERGVLIPIDRNQNRNRFRTRSERVPKFFWSKFIGLIFFGQQIYTVILWCTIEHNGAFTAPQLIV